MTIIPTVAVMIGYFANVKLTLTNVGKLNHGLKEERISESNEQFKGKETR